MRRSILSSIGVLALSVVLVVPLSSSPAGADGGFTDVPGDHPFATEIGWAVGEGITSGFAGGEFRPGQAVSRQAAAAFLYRLAGEPEVTGEAGFSDVPPGHAFHDEIAWMVDRGLTTGFAGGEFRPGQAVSRQAAAAFLYRYEGEPEVSGEAGFSDVPSGHPFETEIAWMVGERITSGFPNGTFRPGNDVTRQAMAAFLYRYTGPHFGERPQYGDDVDIIVSVADVLGPLERIDVQLWNCLEVGFDCVRVQDQVTRADGSVGFSVEPREYPAFYSAVVQGEIDGQRCTWVNRAATLEGAGTGQWWLWVRYVADRAERCEPLSD